MSAVLKPCVVRTEDEEEKLLDGFVRISSKYWPFLKNGDRVAIRLNEIDELTKRKRLIVVFISLNPTENVDEIKGTISLYMNVQTFKYTRRGCKLTAIAYDSIYEIYQDVNALQRMILDKLDRIEDKLTKSKKK